MGWTGEDLSESFGAPDRQERSALYLHAPLLARIRASLRRWLQDGTLAPGQNLDERKLARRLEVSRTPVREAILLLAGEGLVVPRADGGYRAAPMSGGEAADLFRLLGEIESRAVFRAAPFGALGLARLEELDAARVAATTPAERLAMDRRWHHHLLPAHRIGQVCRAELDRLEGMAARYQLVLLAGTDDDRVLVEPVLEHRAMVDDLLADRVARAAVRLERHWLTGAAAAVARWPTSDPGDGAETAAA
jgi:DNA-binding GntR family transcriptional regulator